MIPSSGYESTETQACVLRGGGERKERENQISWHTSAPTAASNSLVEAGISPLPSLPPAISNVHLTPGHSSQREDCHVNGA